LLSPRQLEVLELMAKGLTNREIARVLSISANTVKTHVAAVIEALDVTNRTEAAVALEALGLGSRSGEAEDRYRVAGFGDRPSIAVLPFDDLGEGADQAPLADGLVEDLITRLSANRWFPVIARNSSFAYKGKNVDVRQVSRDLGARYVVEGSVRAVGSRVRVTVQFIDGASGEHLFSQRYDRETADVFALQDQLVDDIVGALEPGVARIDRMRAVTRPPEDLTAWGWTRRGMARFYAGGREDLHEARALFERALESDSHLAAAWSGVAQTHCMEVIRGFAKDRAAALAEAQRTARRAIEDDPADALGHATLAMAHTLAFRLDAAIGGFERAIELNPSYAEPHWGLATIRLYQGESEEARRLLELAVRLSPHDPMIAFIEAFLAAAHVAGGRLEDALVHARRSVQLPPDQPFGPFLLACCGATLGHLDEAREARRALAALAPGFGPAQLRLFLPGALVELLEEGWRLLDSPAS
jgi:adenylate cyclase